jgi:hypothetical protein
VKFIRSDQEQFTFSLGKREKQILFHILQLYPLVPVSHHRLSKGEKSAVPHEDQQALEEALTEHRRENRERILALLDERFHQASNHFQFSLTAPEIQWLLQVLNDLRVGAWIALGEPDEFKVPRINETNGHYLLALDAAGRFQSELLAALGYTEPMRPDESSSPGMDA